MAVSATTAEIRQWARAGGLPVGDRGRLSPDLVAAYQRRALVSDASAVGGSRPQPVTPDPPGPVSALAAVRVVRAKERWDWQRANG